MNEYESMNTSYTITLIERFIIILSWVWRSNFDWESLYLQCLFYKFLESQCLPFCSQVKAKKPSWKIGSSFAIKKTTKTLPKVQIDDDSDLIDEDSLLSEDDLKKPQLPMGKI